jgi:hypothetical protein
VIVRELNKIIVEHNNLKLSINFALFDFEVLEDRLVILEGNDVALIIPNPERELINQAYAAINIKGKQGDKGTKGDKGERGLQGEKGERGEKGEKGEQGEKGEKGDKGDKGQDGINGTNGTNGINGKDGKDGANGKDGIDGKDGKDGLNGKNGIDGKDGIDGKQGANGRNGLDGADGISFVFRGDWQENVTYNLQDVVRYERALFIAKKETTQQPVKVDINEDWELFLLDGINGRNGRDGIDAGAVSVTFQEITFDVTNDLLPITSSAVNYLNIDFTNFNTDIDLTNQLPTNLPKGARVILRKIDTNRGRILYNDSVIFYNFVKKQGDYLELHWNGSKFII